MEGKNFFIENRRHSIFNSLSMNVGCKPSDESNYMFNDSEVNKIIHDLPECSSEFRTFYGGQDMVNKTARKCLLLDECSEKLNEHPDIIRRVNNVYKYRVNRVDKGINKASNRPKEFYVKVLAQKDYLAIPMLSSGFRKYIPMEFLSKDILVSNGVLMIEGANLYHFGVLTSSVHMEWVQTFCGKYGSSIRYSKGVIYNNFPWPNPTKKQKQKIEETAQHILDIRAKYPDKTYAYFYNTETMPEDLKEAHRQNDLAVMDAYNIPEGATTEEIIEHLIGMYVKRVEELGGK